MCNIKVKQITGIPFSPSKNRIVFYDNDVLKNVFGITSSAIVLQLNKTVSISSSGLKETITAVRYKTNLQF